MGDPASRPSGWAERLTAGPAVTCMLFAIASMTVGYINFNNATELIIRLRNLTFINKTPSIGCDINAAGAILKVYRL